MSTMTSSEENRPWTKPAVRNVQGTPVARPKRNAQVQAYIPAWIRGTGLTMKHFFTNVKDRILGDKLDPVLESFESGITIAASLHGLASVPHGEIFEFCMSDSPLRHELTVERFEVGEGMVTVPDGPGLGVTVDEQTIEKYRVA